MQSYTTGCSVADTAFSPDGLPLARALLVFQRYGCAEIAARRAAVSASDLQAVIDSIGEPAVMAADEVARAGIAMFAQRLDQLPAAVRRGDRRARAVFALPGVSERAMRAEGASRNLMRGTAIAGVSS